MAKPRGRRTTHVAVYLSAAESRAWDFLRSHEYGSGWAGTAHPSRATWLMARVRDELGVLADAEPVTPQTRAAHALLNALDDECRHFGDPDSARSHGRIRPTRVPAGNSPVPP